MYNLYARICCNSQEPVLALGTRYINQIEADAGYVVIFVENFDLGLNLGIPGSNKNAMSALNESVLIALHLRDKSTLNSFIGVDDMEMNIYGSCRVLGFRWHPLGCKFTFEGSFTSSSDVATTTSG